MKKISLSAILVLATAVFVAAYSLPATTVMAYSCGTDSKGNPIQTSIDFGNSSLCNADGANPITAILLWAIGFLAAGVGIAVVIGIIFGGITYAMSDGDAGKAKEGQGMIVNAVIGLFLFIFLWAGANFLIPGGVFNP